jgi:hypothetical protein
VVFGVYMICTCWDFGVVLLCSGLTDMEDMMNTENSIRVGSYMIVSGQNHLYGANLEGQDLRFRDLRGSDLRFSNLRDVDFTGANFFLAKVVLPAGWHLVDWIAYRIPGSDSFVRPVRNKYFVRRHPEDIRAWYVVPRWELEPLPRRLGAEVKS